MQIQQSFKVKITKKLPNLELAFYITATDATS